MRSSLFRADLFGLAEEKGDCHSVTHLGILRGDHCPSAFDFSQAADLSALGWTHHQIHRGDDSREPWEDRIQGGKGQELTHPLPHS